MAAGPSTKVVINDFGRIGRTRFGAGSAVRTSLSVLWPSRGVHDSKTTRHLLMHYAVLGTIKNEMQSVNDVASNSAGSSVPLESETDGDLASVQQQLSSSISEQQQHTATSWP